MQILKKYVYVYVIRYNIMKRMWITTSDPYSSLKINY